MRAVVVADGALVVEERPDPVPGPTEVLIEVAGAGINGADLLQRRGLYPAPLGSPADIPGLELSGTVVARGDRVAGTRVGDRVMAVVGGGAQASLAVVEAAHLLAVPDDVDLTLAGGFPEAFSTAHDALVTQARLRSGDRLLVTGAAGGVGTAAVQLGVLLGATVVASVRAAQLHPAVAALGAEVISPDEVADHGPYDVVLELVGGPSLEGIVPHLAEHARIAVIGVGAGAKVELNLLALMGRRAQITGSTLRARSVVDKALVAQRVRHELLGHLESGRLQIPLVATFPLEQATAAYERFSEGMKFGKVLLAAS